MSHPRGRAGTGVQQGPGQGGSQYPLLQPSADVQRLLADAYLLYVDHGRELQLPFRIRYLYGFGSDVVAVPITPVNTHEVLIVDANNETVFSSLLATGFKSVAWDSRLRLLEWLDADGQICRLAYHTEWGPDDTPSTYPVYLEPTSAKLQNRAVERAARQLRSLQIGETVLNLGGEAGRKNVIFQGGYNTEWTTEGVTREGAKRVSRITLSAEPGSGLGRYDGCDDVADPILRRINGQTADESGNFFLDTSGCHRFERPLINYYPPQVWDHGLMLAVSVRDHAIQVVNDCEPCCDCQDFISVYEALRRLRNTYADLVLRVQAVRDQYHANIDRFEAAKTCRETRKVRINLLPFCEGRVGFAVGFCNTTDTCLRNVVLPISFDYADVNGCDAAAATTATFELIHPGSTFRVGNVPPVPTETDSRQEAYQLIGEYPHFFAHFDGIDPGSIGFVIFFAQFGGDTSQVVAMVSDAYQLDAPPVYDGITLIPGYTPGQGRTGVVTATHLVDCPTAREAGLLLCE